MNLCKFILLSFFLISGFWCGARAEVINVKAFGAKGDGKTDDVRAIQEAINYCKEDRLNTIYFPPGTYVLSSWKCTTNYLENYFLGLHSNLILKGDGDLSIIRLANHLFDKPDTSANAHIFYGQNIKNVSFNGLTINLNGAYNLVPKEAIKNNCAIFINHGEKVELRNNIFRNASGRNVIIILGRGRNLVAEKNQFINGGQNAGGSTLNKYQNDFSFFYCEWDSARIVNNLFKQNNIGFALSGLCGGIELHGSFSYAALNIIRGCNPAIYISSSWHPMEQTTVEKNRFEDCIRGISFWVNYSMDSIIIRDNQILLTHFRGWKNYVSSGIEMPNGNTDIYDFGHANGAKVNRLIITGNKIINTTKQQTTDRSTAMVLHSICNATIANNLVKGMSFAGIILQGSKWGMTNVTVKANSFADFVSNYDTITPSSYITVFDSYILVDKNAPGIRNILIDGNKFKGHAVSAQRKKIITSKKGRFSPLYIALPKSMQIEIQFKHNVFKHKEENKVEYVNTQ